VVFPRATYEVLLFDSKNKKVPLFGGKMKSVPNFSTRYKFFWCPARIFFREYDALLINEYQYRVLLGCNPKQQEKKDYKHQDHYYELIYAPCH
jgi:hypothetical protein